MKTPDTSPYDAAAAAEKEARERLAGIAAKHATAAEAVEAAAAEVRAAREAADATMQEYLVGTVDEDTLSAARRAAEAAGQRHRDAAGLAEAISEALTRQRQAVEDTARATAHARDVFWRAAAVAEKQAVLDLAAETIRRAHALAVHTAGPGHAYRVTPRSVVEDAVEDMVITADQQSATLAALAEEYGVPVR